MTPFSTFMAVVSILFLALFAGGALWEWSIIRTERKRKLQDQERRLYDR